MCAAATAVLALDEWAEAVDVAKNRRAYLMGVLKRVVRETDSTMAQNQKRGFDLPPRKKVRTGATCKLSPATTSLAKAPKKGQGAKDPKKGQGAKDRRAEKRLEKQLAWKKTKAAA